MKQKKRFYILTIKQGLLQHLPRQRQPIDIPEKLKYELNEASLRNVHSLELSYIIELLETSRKALAENMRRN